MVVMVRSVKVDAVPTGREAMVGHDAQLAWGLGESNGLRGAGHLALHTSIRNLAELAGLLARAEGSIAHDHTEAWAEGSHL